MDIVWESYGLLKFWSNRQNMSRSNMWSYGCWHGSMNANVACWLGCMDVDVVWWCGRWFGRLIVQPQRGPIGSCQVAASKWLWRSDHMVGGFWTPTSSEPNQQPAVRPTTICCNWKQNKLYLKFTFKHMFKIGCRRGSTLRLPCQGPTV